MTRPISSVNATTPICHADGACALQRAGEAGSLLPAPENVATDPASVIARLLVQSSQLKRAGNEISARTEEAAEDAADARRIDAMRAKANNEMMAGIAAGGSQLLGGAGTALTGITGKSGWEVGGVAAVGTGKLFETGFKAELNRFDRAIAQEESGAKVAKRAQDQLRRQVEGATQHEGKVMQLLQEIKQAQAQCERAMLLRTA